MELVLPLTPILYASLGLVMYWILRRVWRYATSDAPKVTVPIDVADVRGKPEARRIDAAQVAGKPPADKLLCWDPATMENLGDMQPMSADEVQRAIDAARVAQRAWVRTSFETRRRFLRTLQRFIVENTDTIAAGALFALVCTRQCSQLARFRRLASVACRDSGKTKIDAMFGEILVTLEKLRWIIDSGEQYLQPECVCLPWAVGW